MLIVNEFAIAIGGTWMAAVGIDFLAITAEGGSKGKGKIDEDEVIAEGTGIAAFIMMCLSSLATAALFVHAVYASALAYNPVLKFIAAGSVLVMMVGGSLLGQGIASVSPGFRKFCATVQLPLGLLALGAVLYVTYPSLALFWKIVGGFFAPAPTDY